MSNIYKHNKLTNYSLIHNEWARLGVYRLYRKSDGFTMKDTRGRVLGRYKTLPDGILALLKQKEEKYGE